MNCIFCDSVLIKHESIRYICNFCSKIDDDCEIKILYEVIIYNEPTECHDDHIIRYFIYFIPKNNNGFVVGYEVNHKLYKIYSAIFDEKIPGHTVDYSNYIQLDNLNITPQNIKNKIYTIIAFS
jgi:hypothetical protein